VADSLSHLKNQYKDHPGFIMSCGPSINSIDLEKLKWKLVIGTSLAYKSGVSLAYSCMGDKQIASQFWQELYDLPTTLIVSQTIKNSFFSDRPRTYGFEGTYTRRFCTDLSKGYIYGGGTSTFLAMQLAYWLGMNPVYCIGLDHYKTYEDGIGNISSTGRKNLSGKPLVVAEGKDKHHFTNDFYGKGTKYFLPTIDKMTASYKLTRVAYERNKREIYNLSPNTNLSEDIIPRKDFEEVINEI